MKKILFSCLISTICLILLSCTNTNTSYTVTEEPNLFEEWFEKYQEDNPTWTRSIEGHNKLKEAFRNLPRHRLHRELRQCGVHTQGENAAHARFRHIPGGALRIPSESWA